MKHKTHKKNLNTMFVGLKNSGKSTLAGHLIHKGGCADGKMLALQQQQYYDIIGKKYANEAKNSWLIQKLKIDKETDVQPELSLFRFQTQTYKCTISQTSGHKEFAKNLIFGKSVLDFIIVVVSSLQGQFEFGMQADGTIRAQLNLIKYLGVKNVIVCANKMDSKFVDFSQQRYKHIKHQMQMLMLQIGFKANNVSCIPISAQNGDNLFQKSAHTIWYKGQTLIAAIDSIKLEKISEKPLRFTIEDVFKIGGIGIVPVGRVECGLLKQKMDIVFAPSGIKSNVYSLQMGHTPEPEAIPGDRMGFNVKNITISQIKRGNVVGDPKNCPPIGINTVTAWIVALRDCEQMNAGFSALFRCHNIRIECQIEEIVQKLNRRDGIPLKQQSKIINKFESAIVILKLNKLVCCEKFAEYPSLGRFKLENDHRMIAVGIII